MRSAKHKRNKTDYEKKLDADGEIAGSAICISCDRNGVCLQKKNIHFYNIASAAKIRQHFQFTIYIRIKHEIKQPLVAALQPGAVLFHPEFVLGYFVVLGLGFWAACLICF